MSTAPSGWTTPKTNWLTSDPIVVADLNRAEGNSAAIETGSRTLDQALAAPANIGTLRQILSWFAGRLQAITGATNWFDAPATTLAAAQAHHAANTGVHRTTGSGAGVRHITFSTVAPGAADGTDGDVWMVHN